MKKFILYTIILCFLLICLFAALYFNRIKKSKSLFKIDYSLPVEKKSYEEYDTYDFNKNFNYEKYFDFKALKNMNYDEMSRFESFFKVGYINTFLSKIMLILRIVDYFNLYPSEKESDKGKLCK